VETQADAEWLRDLGCEYAQGYYFSPPLPRAEALDFIARHYRAETGQA
jgi:EAL domain-containing protein (putative c-di-GMP-specific phosphodiesterase class I)